MCGEMVQLSDEAVGEGRTRADLVVEELCGVLEPEDLLDGVAERESGLGLAQAGTLNSVDDRGVVALDTGRDDARHQSVHISEFREHRKMLRRAGRLPRSRSSATALEASGESKGKLGTRNPAVPFMQEL